MRKASNPLALRWLYLALGVIVLLFAGIIYGWSILKAPLAESFGWTASALAVNFTITMCFFCLGGMAGGLLVKRLGSRSTLFLAALLACGGFLLTSRLSGDHVGALYLSYGVLASLGIGIAYNVIISAVNAWFPDKKGLCSGALLMGFGASALVVGSAAGALIQCPSVGWRMTFALLGGCLGLMIALAAVLLQTPGSEVVLPAAARRTEGPEEDFTPRDYTPQEMLRRGTFWRAFLCIIFLAAVGNTVISFARDLALSVGAKAGLATTLVGILSVCNGLGRIAAGAVFDRAGRRKAMLLVNVVTIAAAGVTLLSVYLRSLPLCVAGLCVTGLSYGGCPTISSAFVASFYGARHFPVNFSIINFNLMFASFMATAASMVLTATGGYAAPFLFLLLLSVLALFLNVGIRRP